MSQIAIFDKDVQPVVLDSRAWDSKEHPVHVSIEDDHASTHEGLRFTAITSASLGNGATAEISFETGSKTAEFSFDAVFTFSGSYDFWAGGTVGGGVAIPPINTSFLNIHSGVTQECVLTAGSTLTGGTNKMVAPVVVGSAGKAGGEANSVWLFEANSTYTLKVTSLAASNTVTVSTWWVEH